ncbi:ABC transporter permease [Pendulispora albinea]|uniref:ABC transporter permease n=1 Tax=Pendulispora albinea TaxID=2741071 RepID=A0ABZ2LXG0_9BACT
MKLLLPITRPLGRALVPIRLALRAIRRNAMRATLTVLGILIGVAAVVIVTSLGAGARDAVSRQLDTLGSNLIFLFPRSTSASGARSRTVTGRLTEEDARAIVRESTSVARVSPTIATRVQVFNGDSSYSTQVMGVTSEWFAVHRWTFAAGAMWSDGDALLKAKVCILGQTVKTRLFGSQDPVGQVIRIGNYPYRITGVLDGKGDLFGGDQDDIVVTPLGGVRSRFARMAPGTVHSMTLTATSAETTDRAVEQITSVLRQRHRLHEGAEPDFEMHTQKEIQEVQQTIFTVLTVLLVAAAAISLLVGGIGIMNIMLVSVTERTREIGIRMAIGAREGDILLQFLVEAVVLSFLGGVAGAAVGAVCVAGIGHALGWSMSVSGVSLAISLIVSAVIGIAFGFFPARRAAKLDPIDALRHE